MNIKTPTRWAALLSCLVLAACGGGGGDSGGGNTVSNTAALSAGSAAVAALSPQTAGTAVLPVEVMGANGTVVSVQVPAANGSSADTLWLQANNLSYANKASVSVNGGAWTPLNNSTVAVQEPTALAYGGIGGNGFDTFSMTLPITGGVNGMNTVSFRFNQTDGVSSGFRVLAFNLRAGSTNLIAASAFVEADPTQWTAPLADAADIAAGAALWKTAPLVSSSMTATPISAHCMDCHTANGSDLQRFNYSNYSIAQRAQFHGLNAQQGLQIASYIRSLATQYGTPGPNCRPWNPPYQPGPGLDAVDVKDWTCGAGIGAVTANDLDTLQSVFPGGTPTAAAVDFGGQLNIRQIPIGIELPDWNHWLPRIAPIDAWGATFTGSTLAAQYPFLRNALQNGGTAYANGQGSQQIFNDFYQFGVDYSEQFLQLPAVTAIAPATATIAQQDMIYSTRQWMTVKAWELAQDFSLETACPQAWVNLENAPKPELRSWCGYYGFAFQASPHIIGLPENSTSMFGSATGSMFRSNQWYQLQILLNPGSGAHSEQNPVDWQYATGVFNDLSDDSGRLEPIRKFVYMVKAAQEMDNGKGVTNVGAGWTQRDTNPMDLWENGQSGIWKGTDIATEQALVNIYLANWVKVSDSFNINTWERVDSPGSDSPNWCGWSQRSLCWANYVPGTLEGVSPTLQNFPTWAFTMVPQMRAEGMDGPTLNSFLAWLNTAYPSGGYLGLVQ